MIASLQSSRVFALSILAGLIAGGIAVAANAALVQPYTNAIVELWIDELLAEGEFDEEEFDLQTQSIYSSQVTGYIINGLAAGALVGGVYVFSSSSSSDSKLPTAAATTTTTTITSPFKVAVMIAGAAWFVLYVVPAVKYPSSPEALLDSEAAGSYYPLYAGYVTVSGLSALGVATGFRRVKRKDKVFGMAALYLAVMAAVFFAFPDHQEDTLLFPQPVVNAWRASISAAMTALWFAAGMISGLLWTYGRKSAKAV
jgi:Probable cobalt transporter subunit (CbtA)